MALRNLSKLLPIVLRDTSMNRVSSESLSNMPKFDFIIVNASIQIVRNRKRPIDLRSWCRKQMKLLGAIYQIRLKTTCEMRSTARISCQRIKSMNILQETI